MKNKKTKEKTRREVKYTLHKFLPWQAELFGCQSKYRVGCCGRGSGKTDLAISDLSINISYLLDGNAAIICPESKEQTIRIYWERIKDILLQLPDAVDTSIKWYNDSTHTIKVRHKSNLIYLFSGSEQAAEGLRGQEFAYILLDEVGNFERWVWDSIIEPMTARTILKKVLFISTPNGVNNLFHDLYNFGLYGTRGDPMYTDYRSFHATSYDNLIGNNKNTLDLIKQRKGEDSLEWRREYMAEFVGAEGAVFPKFGSTTGNITTRAVYYVSPDWSTYAAIDFGYRVGVTILFQVHKLTNNINIFGEYLNISRGFMEERNESASQAQHLVSSIQKYNIKGIFVDCAGAQHSTETGKSLVGLLGQAGVQNVVPVPKHENDFRDYTEQIRMLICDGNGNPHLFIHPDCKYGVESFYNIRYPEKIGKNPHKYLKDNKYDHYIDAFRYAIKYLFPVANNAVNSDVIELL